MKSFKLSKYNVTFSRNTTKYLWNTFSNAFIELDESDVDFIEGFDGYDDGSDKFNTLRDNGCIVDSRFDEIGKVLYDEKAVMLNHEPTVLHYTIAPGLECNYNCPYCFEKDRTSKKVMSLEMQNKVCDFIIKNADGNRNAKQICITWFGGEPLLYMDAIQHISTRIIKYCKNHNIIFNAGIVTNGRFLTVDNAKILRKMKVEYVQMAVDGTKYVYAKAKGTNPGNFDKVVENIVASAELLPITVRINVLDSIDDAICLTDYLLREKQLDGKIKIYIAHIRDYHNKNMQEERLSHMNFLELEKEYIGLFSEGKPFLKESLFYTKPKRRCTTCHSVCDTNFCIGPEGELYRCEHKFGQPANIVGTIDSGRFYTKDEIEYVKHIHPQKCEKCEMLPVCLGGCMNDNALGDVALSCEHFKERLIDYLLLDKESGEDK